MKMKSIVTVGVLILLAFVETFAQTGESAILGKWESDNKELKLEFVKSGNTYQAIYVWGKDLVLSDGKTSKKDINNPDTKLQTRNLIGMIGVKGLIWDGERYKNGKIYNIDKGKYAVDCIARVEKDKLHIKGYWGFSWIGMSIPFHKCN
jgi:Uncharacterized protein conserved in bacteria (DUF2147).